jgi:hypothetical protein
MPHHSRYITIYITNHTHILQYIAQHNTAQHSITVTAVTRTPVLHLHPALAHEEQRVVVGGDRDINPLPRRVQTDVPEVNRREGSGAACMYKREREMVRVRENRSRQVCAELQDTRESEFHNHPLHLPLLVLTNVTHLWCRYTRPRRA